jgi:hypothetical protein
MINDQALTSLQSQLLWLRSRFATTAVTKERLLLVAFESGIGGLHAGALRRREVAAPVKSYEGTQ